MPSLSRGNNEPNSLYVGSDAVQKIYKGSTQVWPATVATPVENQVLDFGSGNNGLYRDNAALLTHLQGGIGSGRVWLAGFVYYDGVAGGGATWSLTRSEDNVNKLFGGPYLSVRRSGQATATIANPGYQTIGWNWCVASFWVAGNVIYGEVSVNGVTATGSYDLGQDTAAFIAAINRLGLGYVADAAPDGFSPNRHCGLCWGTGDATAFTDWVYNNGDFRNPADYDFDADTTLTLLDQVETGARVDDGGGDAVVPVDDLVEGAVWGQVGTVTWATLGPAWVGGLLATHSSSSIEDAATNELVLTYSLPAGTVLGWGAPVVVDTSKLFIYSTKGFGPIKPNGTPTTSISGLDLTVTIPLTRGVYASENIFVDASREWVTDSNGNIGDDGRDKAVTNNIAPATAPDPTLKTGLSMGRISVAFDGSYEAGFDANGRGWVRDTGGGVTVAERYPATTTDDLGRTVNGAEKNPVSRSPSSSFPVQHGYDERGYFYSSTFSAPVSVALSANDTLVVAESNLNAFSGFGGRPGKPVYVREYQGLYVTDNITLTEDDYIPPLVHDPATRPAPTTEASLVDTVENIVAGLPSYSTATHSVEVVPIALVLHRFERLWHTHAQIGSDFTRREMGASEFTAADSFGQEVTAALAAVYLHLIADVATTDQKARLVKALIGHRIQLSELYYGPAGAENQGLWALLTIGEYWLNGTASVGDTFTRHGGNESSAFKITPDILTRITGYHTNTPDADWPRFNQQDTISSVDGLDIGLTLLDAISDGDYRERAYGRLGKLILTRIGTAGTATITGRSEAGVKMTIDAQPTTPFQVGDTVWVNAPWTQAVDDYEWNRLYSLLDYTPSRDAGYRNLNQWSAEVLAVRAIKLRHANYEAVEGYVARANEASNPTSGNDFANHHPRTDVSPREEGLGLATSRAYDWTEAFWTDHWSTIQGIAQKV